jgi:peptidoglycan biosynthesis protein MviN/MurJ (putative lipid II flippase)
MIPAAAGAGVYQLTILINTILASLVGEGAVSALYYADRITQLPIGVFSISLASVLLPILSRAEAQGDRNMASSQLGAALSATSFMMIPFTAFLLSESNIIVRALFERGAFSPDATMATASAVKALSVSLWSVSCSSLLARAFTARKMLNIPLQSAVISLGISMLTAVITMGAPKSELKGLFADSLSFIQTYLPISWSLGHVGLATASTVGSLASTIFLIIRYITLDTSNIGKLMLISLIRALISTGVAFLLASFLFSDFFFLKIILGTFIYILLNFALKSPEIKGIIQILNQKNSEDLS